MRNAFDTIEQLYGSFILRKLQPHWADTSSRGDNMFNIQFNSYVDIDSVAIRIKTIPFVVFSGYDMRIIRKASIPTKQNLSKFIIQNLS